MFTLSIVTDRCLYLKAAQSLDLGVACLGHCTLLRTVGSQVLTEVVEIYGSERFPTARSIRGVKSASQR